MKKLFIMLMSLLMVSNALALGITPGRTTLDFERGMSRTISFDILNVEERNLRLVLTTDGGLAKYMTLSDESVEMSPTETRKTFSYDINLPEKLEPGLQTGKVYAIMLPNLEAKQDTSISATLAVATQLHVNVPYPGKYATASLIIYNIEQGSDAVFVFPVTNKGEFDLTKVYANVDIYDSNNKKVGSFDTKTISIPSGERKELVHKWENDLPVGEYKAFATLVYDEGTITLEESFTIGSNELELQDIIVNDFKLGEIAKLQMLVQNKWSEMFEDVYIETRIKDYEGDVVSSFRSSTYDIEAFAKQMFASYWDTAGVREGTYKAEIEIFYGGKSSQNSLQFEVSQDELVVVGLGYVISSNGDSIGQDNTLIIVLIIAIFVLIFINLLWFMVLRKKMGGSKNK